MSGDRGLEQKPPIPVAVDVLVGEEVTAQKGMEWQGSLLGIRSGHRWLRESPSISVTFLWVF